VKLLVFVALAAVMTSSAMAQRELDPRGIWSSLRLNPESGDLNGIEVMIMPSGKEHLYRTLVQITDGGTLPYTALVEAPK
jgi:hypothetical protein